MVSDSDFSEAVLFIQQNRISREMLYSEFEAVLDGFVPLPDLAGQKAYAVYLRVNQHLLITAAVFFRISFDSQGNADKRWNVPLQQLADNSAKGPDLGAGPIRLACASQCCISWHHQNMWDPDMRPGNNHFVMLKKSIKSNRLGLTYKEPEMPVAPPRPVAQAVSPEQSKALEKKLTQNIKQQFEKEFRNHMAQLLKEQRLRILTLDTKRKHEIQQLQLTHQQRLLEFKENNEELRKELTQQLARNQELKDTIEGQAKKLEGVREYFEHKLKSVAQDEGDNLQSLRENYEAELEAKIEAATLELNEKLQMRDVELMYRNEQEKSLSQEIHRLRQENQMLLNNSSEQLLAKLEKAGLNFVAYHPGAGHLTIPLADMGRYLDNPIAYAAEKCGVSLGHYKDWLDHYKSPSCQAIKEGGELCGALIERVPTPSHFHMGESDRCDHHKTSPTQSFAAVRM